MDFLLFHLQLKDIDDVGVGTAEPEFISRPLRQLATVSQDIYVREGHVHRHWAKLPPFRIEIIAVSYLMTSVTWMIALPVHQCYGNFRLAHDVFSFRAPILWRICYRIPHMFLSGRWRGCFLYFRHPIYHFSV